MPVGWDAKSILRTWAFKLLASIYNNHSVLASELLASRCLETARVFGTVWSATPRRR